MAARQVMPGYGRHDYEINRALRCLVRLRDHFRIQLHTRDLRLSEDPYRGRLRISHVGIRYGLEA